jgi:hypothetical protein
MDETVPKDKTVKSTPADLRSLLTNFDEVGRGADVSVSIQLYHTCIVNYFT